MPLSGRDARLCRRRCPAYARVRFAAHIAVERWTRAQHPSDACGPFFGRPVIDPNGLCSYKPGTARATSPPTSAPQSAALTDGCPSAPANSLRCRKPHAGRMPSRPRGELGGPSMDSQAQSKSERPGSVVGNVSDVHNASVDEEAARQGGCAQVHLPTGRMCTSRHGHNGSCEFSSAGEADAALAKHKAADHW